MRSFKRHYLSSLCAVSLFAMAGNSYSAYAEDSARDWRIPVGIFAGTSGLGVKAGFEYKYVGIYATASTFGKWTINVGSAVNSFANDVAAESDLSFLSSSNAGLKIQDYGIDLRIKPFNGAFHIDVGYHYINYQAFINVGAVTPTPFGDVSMNGVISMKIAKGWKPYFGLGWDIRLFYQFYLTLDLGVMYTGKWDAPNISMDATPLKAKLCDIADDLRTRDSVTYGDLKNMLNLSDEDLGDIFGILGVSDDAVIPSDDLHRFADYITNGVSKGKFVGFDVDNKTLAAGWDNSKISNYAKIWPVVKVGFTYKF